MNARHEKFIDEYIINGFNAKQAYISVYSCSDTVAETNGPRLLGNAQVQEILSEKKKELSNKNMITKEEIILELIKIKDNCIDEPKYSNQAIKALEVLNKMLGYNEPDKIESTSKIIWNEEALNEDDIDDETE